MNQHGVVKTVVPGVAAPRTVPYSKLVRPLPNANGLRFPFTASVKHFNACVHAYCHWTQGGSISSPTAFLGAHVYSANADTSGERTTGMVNKYLHVVMLVHGKHSLPCSLAIPS